MKEMKDQNEDSCPEYNDIFQRTGQTHENHIKELEDHKKDLQRRIDTLEVTDLSNIKTVEEYEAIRDKVPAQVKINLLSMVLVNLEKNQEPPVNRELVIRIAMLGISAQIDSNSIGAKYIRIQKIIYGTVNEPKPTQNLQEGYPENEPGRPKSIYERWKACED